MARKKVSESGIISFDTLGGGFVKYRKDRSFTCSACGVGKNGVEEKTAENHADFCMVIPSHLAYNTDPKKWWKR